jgi:hypothetical protein
MTSTDGSAQPSRSPSQVNPVTAPHDRAVESGGNHELKSFSVPANAAQPPFVFSPTQSWQARGEGTCSARAEIILEVAMQAVLRVNTFDRHKLAQSWHQLD